MNASSATGKRRWLWPLLIVSLGLNLLFVGLVAGRLLMERGGHAKRHHVFTGAIEELMQALPAEKRNLAGSLLENYRTGVKPRRRDVRAARRAAKNAVVAETYDETSLSKELTRLRDLRTDEHQALHTMLLALLKELSLEERKQLLGNIRAGFRKGRYSRKRDKSNGDGPKTGQ